MPFFSFGVWILEQTLLIYFIQIQENGNFPEQSQLVAFPNTSWKCHMIFGVFFYNIIYIVRSFSAILWWQCGVILRHKNEDKWEKKVKKTFGTWKTKLTLCKNLHWLLIYLLVIHATDINIHALKLSYVVCCSMSVFCWIRSMEYTCLSPAFQKRLGKI